MEKAIIVHGICSFQEYYERDVPSPSNFHWIPWLQQELLRKNILCQTPEMPNPYSPKYEDWKNVFEQFKLDEKSIYVGHSAGCGFILKWLSENPNFKFKKLILVAPWLDFDREENDFLEFEFDMDVSKFAEEVHLFCSKDDSDSIIRTKDAILEKSTKVKYYEYSDKGHFVFRTVGDKFEDIFEACLN